MIEFEYIKPKLEEVKLILLFSLILSTLFTISILRFSKTLISVFDILSIFFIFIFCILYLRQSFMKYIAYRNGFEIILRPTYFDRYGIRSYDTLSYDRRNLKHDHHYKGIPSSAICILLYVFTLGTFIFPSIWNYKYKKIEHMHIGTHLSEEYDMPHMFNIGVSDYRMSKAFFAGFLFYFIVALFLKAFFSLIEESYFNWFTFALFWIAFITILPIPGTEGYEFYRKNNFAWISMITILILAMISIIIFNSIFYVILVTVFTSTIMIFVIFYKRILNE